MLGKLTKISTFVFILSVEYVYQLKYIPHEQLITEQVATIEDHHGLSLHLYGQVPVSHDVQLDVLLLDQQHRRCNISQ